VYAERRITERLSGPEVASLNRAIDLAKMNETMDRLGRDSWATHLKLNFEGLEPMGYMTDIQYTKGFEFLMLLEHTVGRPAFDEFVRKYIETYRFRSLTTEQFLAFLHEELPEIEGQVNPDEWIYQPDLPASALPIHSELLDQVRRQVAAYQPGHPPEPGDVDGWIGPQVYLYLLEMPKCIPLEDCRRLEKILGLVDSANDFQLAAFYEIAICSGYRELWPKIESLAERVGRIILVARVFRAMSRTEWSRPLARPLFEKVQARQHPITRAYLDRVLQQSGL
jgi:aminopeptidase N